MSEDKSKFVEEDPEVRFDNFEPEGYSNQQEEKLKEGQKTMSSLSNNSGGALIAPPQQRVGWKIKPTPFRKKST